MSSSSNVGSARFRGPQQQYTNGQDLILPSAINANMAARTRKISSKQISPRRTLEGPSSANQSFTFQNGREASNSKLGKSEQPPRRGTAGSTHTPTTINNNNIVININKNYNNAAAKAGSKLKQVQEESFEEHVGDDIRRSQDSLGNRKSRLGTKGKGGYPPQYESTPTKKATFVNNQQKYQQQIMMVRTSENSMQGRGKYLSQQVPMNHPFLGSQIRGVPPGKINFKKGKL